MTVREVRGNCLITLGKANIRCLKPFRGISALAVVTILKPKGFFIEEGLKVPISIPFGITVIFFSSTLNSEITSSLEG